MRLDTLGFHLTRISIESEIVPIAGDKCCRRCKVPHVMVRVEQLTRIDCTIIPATASRDCTADAVALYMGVVGMLITGRRVHFENISSSSTGLGWGACIRWHYVGVVAVSTQHRVIGTKVWHNSNIAIAQTYRCGNEDDTLISVFLVISLEKEREINVVRGSNSFKIFSTVSSNDPMFHG